jgi:branched-chain amino acid transport system substrate-binding protein
MIERASPRRLAALAVAALSLAACAGNSGGGSSSGNASNKGPVLIGYVNALQGPYAVAGVPELNGVKAAIDEINKAGGAKGRQLQLAATLDDQGQATQSTAAFRRAVSENNVSAVLGPGITPPGLADADIAESSKVLQINFIAQKEAWQGKTYVWSAVGDQGLIAQAMVNYMAKRNAKKVDILYVNIPYGVAGFNFLKQQAPAKGMTVGVTDNWDVGGFDFTPQVQKVIADRPDGVFLWGAAAPSDSQVLKQLRQAGFQGPVVGDAAYSLPNVPSVAGPAADTIVAVSQLNLVNPDARTQKFVDDYKTVSGSPTLPSYLAGTAYDSVYVLKTAVERANGDSDPTKLARAMVGLNHQGVTGAFKYTADNHAGPGLDSFVAITYKNGQYAAAP